MNPQVTLSHVHYASHAALEALGRPRERVRRSRGTEGSPIQNTFGPRRIHSDGYLPHRGHEECPLSLQDLQDNIKNTNQRLATGKKVNSALDNALNFFVADSFSSKARGLSTIQDNIGLGLNVLKQTDKALNSMRMSLDQAEGTLRAAINTSAPTPA